MQRKPGVFSVLCAGLMLALIALVGAALIAGSSASAKRKRLLEVSGKSAQPPGGPSGVVLPECELWQPGAAPEPFRRCWNSRSVALMMAIANGKVNPQHTDYKALVGAQSKIAFDLSRKITERSCKPAVGCLRLRYDLVEDYMHFAGLVADSTSQK